MDDNGEAARGVQSSRKFVMARTTQIFRLFSTVRLQSTVMEFDATPTPRIWEMLIWVLLRRTTGRTSRIEQWVELTRAFVAPLSKLTRGNTKRVRDTYIGEQPFRCGKPCKLPGRRGREETIRPHLTLQSPCDYYAGYSFRI